MIFYRVQSKHYEITKDSRSFWNGYNSVTEAMEDDIYWALNDCEDIDGDCYHLMLNFSEDNVCCQTTLEIIEKYNFKVGEFNDDETIKKVWNEVFDEYGLDSERIHNGVSCFQTLEELNDYVENYGKDTYLFDSEREYYILEFEGEFVGIGPDGEDLAIFKHEISRTEM